MWAAHRRSAIPGLSATARDRTSSESRPTVRGQQSAESRRFTVEKADQASPQRIRMRGLTFPDDADIPAVGLQFVHVAHVSRLVPPDLLSPVTDSAGWKPPLATNMAVPEATMDEYHLAPWRKDEVGAPGKVASVECVAVSQAVKNLPHAHLGCGVRLGDGSHDPRPDLGCEIVNHLRLVGGRRTQPTPIQVLGALVRNGFCEVAWQRVADHLADIVHVGRIETVIVRKRLK